MREHGDETHIWLWAQRFLETINVGVAHNINKELLVYLSIAAHDCCSLYFEAQH